MQQANICDMTLLMDAAEARALKGRTQDFGVVLWASKCSRWASTRDPSLATTIITANWDAGVQASLGKKPGMSHTR